MLRLPMIVLITALGCETGFAQSDFNSANAQMPGCRDYVARRADFKSGWCGGLVTGIVNAHPMICAPDSATYQQGVRVVIQYIDQRPARLHENFAELVIEALQAAWPCKQ